jgi:hypothetical protein
MLHALVVVFFLLTFCAFFVLLLFVLHALLMVLLFFIHPSCMPCVIIAHASRMLGVACLGHILCMPNATIVVHGLLMLLFLFKNY